MQNTWDGDTRGLGAGSYPEPPDLPEQDGPACEECGWQRDLKEVDSRLLCRDCREDYYLENCRSKYWEFITGSRRIRRDFAVDWWFENLPEETQGEIAFRAFQRELDSCLPQLLNLREEEIAGYVKDHADDFLEYIERENGI